VIRDTALARTVVVQHVAGPKPALLHALPRKQFSDHDARRDDQPSLARRMVWASAHRFRSSPDGRRGG
jgi:hypothetical protein